ncbi:uncharacterized protein LOC110007407 isoform X3 [Amborella trichopoda]|uniref:uncharacterized protein LOC110007407 isoform X3 n=1 Tax=Amborella trichopoda TaxID=13333 RepID=UPI0009C0FF4D|nr:uncharacterized protein LOC110007407 isoform X3 [Amborella trichopoda]|eukprot:XP_020523959.1 uncharacterized protein LOC110007407 isoform X3 [Amborella trichopoda]
MAHEQWLGLGWAYKPWLRTLISTTMSVSGQDHTVHNRAKGVASQQLVSLTKTSSSSAYTPPTPPGPCSESAQTNNPLSSQRLTELEVD